MVPIYCINLERRPDRKYRMANHLESTGLTVIWSTAVDGASIPSLPEGTLVNRGSHACWLSHVAVLRRFSEDHDDGMALILEDDAVLDRSVHWPTMLARASDLMVSDHLDYLQLGYLNSFRTLKANRKALRKRLHFGRRAPFPSDEARLQYWQGKSAPGTHCYMVSKRFAELVKNLNQPVWAPADGFYDCLASQSAMAGSLNMARVLHSLAGQVSRTSSGEVDSDIDA